MSVEASYLTSLRARLKGYRELGDKTFSQLTEEQLNWQPGEGSNSIAVIIRHMHGNMLSRFTNFLTEDGEKPWRKRDEEFEAIPMGKDQLLALWQEGWDCTMRAIDDLRESYLDRTITIRHENHSVVDALNRQLGHYAYHTGQITFLGKMLKGGEWTSLSIPKGASGQFNQEMAKKHKD
ncbi:DUF1572 domain-containing protein [Flavihumibacter rivuli]|uniref:DUF1572 family protein n=1 Tax=Flavihumibacter rivuli TaxID=2838156 RepID=UPI001BDDEFFE|nr:DUF1572 family protein [Flavihumibacter rivuli]ULQ56881.1 DUF1572 domain-containing protein [Flavihumibacter rivuli]